MSSSLLLDTGSSVAGRRPEVRSPGQRTAVLARYQYFLRGLVRELSGLSVGRSGWLE